MEKSKTLIIPNEELEFTDKLINDLELRKVNKLVIKPITRYQNEYESDYTSENGSVDSSADVLDSDSEQESDSNSEHYFKEFNQYDKIPDCVKILYINNILIQNIDKFPNFLTKLVISQITNVKITNLPKTLQVLSIKNFDILNWDNLPTRIKELTIEEIRYEFDLDLLNRFTELDKLYVEKSNCKIKTFPSKIRHLTLRYYNYPIDNIPNTVSHFGFSSYRNNRKDQIILPKNIRNFQTTIYTIESIPKFFPSTLTHLNLVFAYKDFILDNLPKSLQSLKVFSDYSGSIDLSTAINLLDLNIELSETCKSELIRTPSKLKRLKLSIKEFNKPIILSDNIKSIDIDIINGAPIIEYFPDSITNLTINFPYRFTKLSSKLEYYSGPYLDFFIDGTEIPLTLKKVCIQKLYEQNNLNGEFYNPNKKSRDKNEKYIPDNNIHIEKILSGLPECVSDVCVNFFDSLNLKNISPNISSLELITDTNDVEVTIDCIPNTIKNFELFTKWNSKVNFIEDTIPHGVESISFTQVVVSGLNFNNLPTTLKKLHLEVGYLKSDLDLDFMPSSIKELYLSMNNWPKDTIDNLPHGLEKLYIKIESKPKITNLPNTLKQITIES